MADTRCGCELFPGHQCKQEATQEDLLCDQCRLFHGEALSKMHLTNDSLGHITLTSNEIVTIAPLHLNDLIGAQAIVRVDPA